MSTLMVLLVMQIALGGFDNLWHHELKERLPGRREARVEVALHSCRELCYALLFAALAWWTWHGAWTAAVIALLVIEVCVTLADFVVEDQTRRLPKTERVLHTVLAINFGAMLAVFAPTLLTWARLPTAIAPADYGLASWLLTATAAGMLAWSVRNALAARGHFAEPTWRRVGLKPRRSAEPKHVLVTGATGFIGRKLVYRLVSRGDFVIVHARNAAKAADLFGPQVEVITELARVAPETRVDAIINLAGESIAAAPWTRRRRALLLESRLGVTRALLALVARLASKPTTWINASAIGYYGARDGDESLNEKSAAPWTRRRRALLLESRLGVTRALLALVARLASKPTTWINASAIGYYGARDGDESLNEKSAAGKGFQAELCSRWEETAARAADHGVKVSTLRLGVVLSGDGGALPALTRPVRLFAGTVLGTGRQWFSWIHIDDLLDLMLFVLAEATLAGPLNATAPVPVRHEELMTTIAATLRRPLWPVRVPARLLRAGLGELAELFVDGQRVTPDRPQALKFKFRYATIGAALTQALGSSARAMAASEARGEIRPR